MNSRTNRPAGAGSQKSPSRPGWMLPVVGAVGLALVLLALVRGSAPDAPPADASLVMAANAVSVPTEMPKVHGEVPWTFSVPRPEDAEWADYQEMLRTLYRSSVENAGGLDIPYDPEWRAELVGRRAAPVHSLGLTSGAGSVEQLIKFFVLALSDEDEDMLRDLRVSHHEFKHIFWPEMPRSRPFLKIPAEEAWSFHYASAEKGAREVLMRLGGQPLEVVTVGMGRTEEFTNFQIHRDVVISVRNVDTQVVTPIKVSLVTCKDRVKLYMIDA